MLGFDPAFWNSLTPRFGIDGSNQKGAAAIAQTGVIDAGTKSVLFSATQEQDFNVIFRGATLPVVPVQTVSDYTIYGADVSAFAGQSGELRFSAAYNGQIFLDDIHFSTTAVVPEPSTVSFLFGGGFFILITFRYRKSRNRTRALTCPVFPGPIDSPSHRVY